MARQLKYNHNIMGYHRRTRSSIRVLPIIISIFTVFSVCMSVDAQDSAAAAPLASTPVAAASNATGATSRTFGLILYAVGKDVTVYRSGRLMTYNLNRSDVIGLPLFQNDLVQTDSGTYLEIQLLPSMSVIKVAENTTFRIDSIGDQGQASINLTYGRIRAKVEHIAQSVAANSYPFTIRGPTTVAGVRGTDFGYDFVAERNIANIPVTQVYCFDGTVEVSGSTPAPAGQSSTAGNGPQAGAAPTGAPAGAAAAESKPVLIHANEMVSVAAVQISGTEGKEAATAAGSATPGAPTSLVFQTDPVSKSITTYWKENDFESTPVAPAQATTVYPGLEEALDKHFSETPPANATTTATAGAANETSATSPTSGTTAAAAPATTTPAQAETATNPSGAASPAPAEPSPAAPAAGTPAGAANAPTAGAGNAETPELNPAVTKEIGRFENLGLGFASAGILAGAGAGAMFVFGPTLFPSMSGPTQTTITVALGASGAVFLITGIVAYVHALTLR